MCVYCWQCKDVEYIDDVIMIWEESVDELDEFMCILNQNDLNNKLTHKFGTNMDFLDTVFKVDDLGFKQSDLYCKKTAINCQAPRIHRHLLGAYPLVDSYKLSKSGFGKTSQRTVPEIPRQGLQRKLVIEEPNMLNGMTC